MARKPKYTPPKTDPIVVTTRSRVSNNSDQWPLTSLVRALAIGQRLNPKHLSWYDVEHLEWLVKAGYAELPFEGGYVATEQLHQLAASEAAQRRPALELVPTLTAAQKRRYLTKQRPDRPVRPISAAALGGYQFPHYSAVNHRFMVEAQAPDEVTTNEDGELSSAEVTRWYVEQFEKLNNLRRTA